jgi:demethylmenaquinone methyltransferase/2-methoxy-6-polyprenyl-1,4-benzoquinol methylase
VNKATAPDLPHGDPATVAAMFGRIAHRYDLMNRLMSMGLDGGWRKLAAGETQLEAGDRALDIASGTGDLAFELAKRVGHTGFVVGIDIAREMLVLGREKSLRRQERRVDHHEGDAMRLPYADGSFRAATMAFGGRNVPDLAGAFSEMKRVLTPGGRVVFLELNRPGLWGFRHLFDFYFHTFSPLVGGLLSGDRSAYEYLPRSVDNFESVEEISRCLHDAGLTQVRVRRLFFGACNLHIAVNPAKEPSPEP